MYLTQRRSYAVYAAMGGDDAVARSTKAMSAAFVALEDDSLAGSPSASSKALEIANRAFWNANLEAGRARKDGAGCVAAILTLTPADASIAWLGDVRVYRSRNDRLELLTIDHTLRNDYARRGLIAADDESVLRNIPPNVIVRAMGMSEESEVEGRVEPSERDDLFLLATHELCAAMGDARLAITVNMHRDDDPRACVQALLSDARARGGKGELTALVVAPSAKQTPPRHAAAVALEPPARRLA